MSPASTPHTPGGFPEAQEAETPQQSLPATPAAESTTPGNETTTPKDAIPTPQLDAITVDPPSLQKQPLYPELPQEMEVEKDENENTKTQKEQTKGVIIQQTPEQVTPQQKTPSKHSSLFIEDEQTGHATPSFIFRPQSRKSTGLGIDRQGLGSPKVAELLDRRRSIGDEAESFSPAIPPSRGVRFDPQEMEKEIEKERQAEEAAQQSEKGATSNLKDLIQSMSPKKKPVKMARKSLHVGSAVGLLGKRPAELDVDSDEEEEHTPKRFRGNEASPVKSVRLPAPPSKDQTTGRLGPRLKGAQSTPESQKHSESDPNYEAIRLQDFLNMTNIHFMELTTTKRRHTVAPKDKPRTSRDDPEKDITLADCVVAGATTLPLLEMYQHSCRELKKYIAEGRNIIRSIEEETFADNPPLFKEYMSASPDIRALMDNQFRNVKTNARLQSKAMWYEWRMKLLDGLKQGLDKHLEDMKHDEEIIFKKEELVNSVLPQALEQRSNLEEQVDRMRQRVEELQSADREEILATRKKLVDADRRLTEKRKELKQNQTQHEEMADTLKSAAEMKADLLKEIQEGERLLAERRACGLQEMRQLKASIKAMEKRCGWSILSAHGEPESEVGPCMVMRYRDELKVAFHPKTFGDQSTTQFPSISFEFAPKWSDSGADSVPPGAVKSLMLCAMNEKLAHLPSKVKDMSPKDFLKGIARDWDRAAALNDEVQYLRFCGVTRTKVISECQLRVRCMLISPHRGQQSSMLENDKTPDEHGHLTKSRIDIDFNISSKLVDDREVDVDIKVSAVAVYGIESNIKKQITDFLTRTVAQGRDPASGVGTNKGLWRDAIRKCEKKVF
ncbi:hypothetical protein KEM56_002355 [Ascosphaera pollenicola]|nr:hypothetical protein KEM56_002355 [Ascosphaera pollenicola]